VIVRKPGLQAIRAEFSLNISILKEGATVTEAEPVAWSKQNMADYRYRRIIEFRQALPMNATGKILKNDL
jgi:long-chain acyl-CoA synthetase